MKPVKLKDIIDSLDVQMDQIRSYLNTETGEIIALSTEELDIAEESEGDIDFSKYPEWQRDLINEAIDVLDNWNTNKYIELPDRWYVNEYSIMEEFCSSVRDEKIRNVLFSAIRGSGAFRRFKDVIHIFDLQDSWYKFRFEALKKIAIQWCEENGISYIET
ncbi:MAG: hypothetical protein GX428_06870 [Candidatus Atribacteria bacterium]|nr:hypothetical protein [Candidatus Atribacteria bacterium]